MIHIFKVGIKSSLDKSISLMFPICHVIIVRRGFQMTRLFKKKNFFFFLYIFFPFSDRKTVSVKNIFRSSLNKRRNRRGKLYIYIYVILHFCHILLYLIIIYLFLCHSFPTLNYFIRNTVTHFFLQGVIKDYTNIDLKNIQNKQYNIYIQIITDF